MLEIINLNLDMWPQYEKDVMALEALAFSAEQCHPPQFYLDILSNERSTCQLALVDGKFAGFVFAGPLELFAKTPGVTDDMYYGERKAIYCADIVVSPDFRKQGIAKSLKLKQYEEAKKLSYSVVAERNRLKYAEGMWRINQSLGAKEVQRLKGIYVDGREPNECIYHHRYI